MLVSRFGQNRLNSLGARAHVAKKKDFLAETRKIQEPAVPSGTGWLKILKQEHSNDKIKLDSSYYYPLAHMVEHGTLNPKFVGSSPMLGDFFCRACYCTV